MGKEWHRLDIQEVFKELNTDRDGLASAEAGARLARFGPNELKEEKKISALRIFLDQFKNLLIIILLIAVLISAAIGDAIEAAVIGVIVLFAAILGFVQEYRAEKAMDALKKMAAPAATVIRDGKETDIPARELVPGDLIVLKTGDRIPSDARLVEAVNLKVEEASLTGESVPVDKDIAPIPLAGIPPGDMKNMVFMGTSVSYGRGKGIVVETGMRTEFGKIARMLSGVVEERTPLQENLDRLGKTLIKASLFVVAVIIIFGTIRGEKFLDMLIWGVALAVAVVPEALPAVVTVSLAIGVRRMVKRSALVRRLKAVETLGSTSVICSDKTGTLTKDEMTVRQVHVNGRTINVAGAGYDPRGEFSINGSNFDPGEIHLKTLLTAGMLCNDAVVIQKDGGKDGRKDSGKDDGKWSIKGDPTEGALVVAAIKGRLGQEIRERYPRIDEIPFTSERKMMTTIHMADGKKTAYSKGAPEVISGCCSKILKDGVEKDFTGSEKEDILDIVSGMADRAMRVIALAYRVLPSSQINKNEVERDMVFTGLVGMIDPPRPEVKEAIAKCESAGIRTVMITGDHKSTGMAVARELGLAKSGLALTGAELDAMDDDEFGRIVDDVDVYARVSPAHKLRIVTALSKKGHVVAMTGDGVNDAPALKKADIGIAMGITGTDVTKEAADMILTDDNFASIVAAVEEGRIIFGNIKKYLMYLLSSNLGEILLMATAVFAGYPLPLAAVQILYVNLATDGLPAIALSVDPAEKDVMRQHPRDPRKGLFTKPVILLMILGGIWSAAVNLWIFEHAQNTGKSLLEAQSMVFVSLITIQFFKAYNFRSERNSIFKMGFFRNKWLNLAVAWETFLLILIVYLPQLHGPFNTFSLTLDDWKIALFFALTIFPVLELGKVVIRRRNINNRG